MSYSAAKSQSRAATGGWNNFISQTIGLPSDELSAAVDQGLLLVVFNDLWRAHLCLIWVAPKLSQSSALAQQIPTLVQFDLYLR